MAGTDAAYSIEAKRLPGEDEMGTKTVEFNTTGIEKLPNDKPVVYKILTGHGENAYTGVAKRGRVQERLREHLPTGREPIPGARVRIEQMPSIDEARAKEVRIIRRSKPAHNKRGK